MSYIKSRRVVEHTWVCSTCDHTNLGRHLECPGCGKPKNKNEAYDETVKNTVTDPMVLAESRRGANWSCVYCKAQTRGDTNICIQCGASRKSLKSSAKLSSKKVGEKQQDNLSRSMDRLLEKHDVVDAAINTHLSLTKPLHEIMAATETPTPSHEFMQDQDNAGYRDSAKNEPEESMPEWAPPPSRFTDLSGGPFNIWLMKRETRKRVAVGAGAVVAVCAFVWGMIWLFTPWRENVTVTSATWARTASVQQRITLNGEGWDGDMPGSSFNASCVTRQHGTHRCNPHDCNPHSVSYECNCHSVQTGESCHESCRSNGNGFSNCQTSCSPTYSTECSTCSRTEYDTCYEQCPTWDQWCTYQYYEWPTIHTMTTRGTDNDDVVWPALYVDRNPPSPQRLVRTEIFAVRFVNENDSWQYAPASVQDFHRFHRQIPWIIEVTHTGRVTPISQVTTPNR